MKTKILLILLILALAVPLTAAPPAKHKSAETSALIVDNTTWIDANNILMFVTNHGNFGRDLTDMFGADAGTFFPFTTIEDLQSGKQATWVNYASGLWIGGQVGGETRVTIAEYSDEYVPGPMLGTTYSPDTPDFHVYKLYKDSLADNPNEDYLNWPVDQGAPVVDDGFGNMVPDMIGDQMLWSVYNDADPAEHTNDAGETLPLGLELRQTTFAFDREDPLGNVIFIKLQVFNYGGNTITDCYLSLWADPDLGGAGDDLVGSDIEKSLGFVYNATNDDSQFGSTPPCLGYDFFQGPMVYSPGDTARMWGQLWPDSANLGMTSFNRYINGTDPNSFDESYSYMRGLKANGDPYVYEGDTLLYMHAGDPVTGVGDLDFDPADRRFMQSTGPITFAPGDSTEILAAIIVGQGSDRLSSISVMKYYDQFAQSAYDINFDLPEPPAPPDVGWANLHDEVSLFWGDDSELDPGSYPFEGYTVYQGESAAGPWRRVANYDINNGVGTILDDVIDIETGTLELRGVKFGTDPGVRRYFSTTQDAIIGGKLNDMTTYYYKVEAYSYDPAATPRTLTSATIIAATPQAPIAGVDHSFFNGDTIAVTHPPGSDGAVLPIVLDPEALNGHTYQVVFEDTVGIVKDTHYTDDDPPVIDWIEDVVNIAWHLYDRDDPDTSALLRWQINQSGDDDYSVIDGMIIKIMGPDLVGLDWDYTSASPANISPNATLEYPDYTGGRWITSADGSDGELFFGGIYLGVNFNGSSLAPADYRDAEIRFTPLASYTDLNSDGEYTPGEPYVVVDPSATQDAFMYGGFSDGAYSGFHNVPFTAWDVSDPANARQLNVVVRDRDGNDQWDLHNQVADAALPNGGDQRFNYVWLLNTDYDATGTMYGDGVGNIGFMSTMSGAMWTGWFGDRGNGAMLAEEGTMFLDAPAVNTIADTFTFVATAPTSVASQDALENIKVVPNPFYLYSTYDPSPGNNSLKFTHLPTKCKISIYNLAGEFVEMIEKNDPATSIAEWNGNTYKGLPVASGIYIYVVEAEGYGQKIGKFAIFKEVEVLKKF